MLQHMDISVSIPPCIHSYINCNCLNTLKNNSLDKPIVLILSLFIGLVFDAIRTAIVHERIYKGKMQKVWKLFEKADKEVIDTFENYYYSYFVFECNICIAMLFLCTIEVLVALMSLCFLPQAMLNCHLLLISVTTVALFVIFVCDAKKHMCYMLKYIEAKQPVLFLNQTKDQNEC